MDLYWLLVGILATWRVTHLLWAEDGPWRIVARLRRRAGTGFWGSLMDCFNCLTLWVAAALVPLVGVGLRHSLLLWVALSGGAILVERRTARQEGSDASYVEHPPGGDDGLLWQREEASRERVDRGDPGP